MKRKKFWVVFFSISCLVLLLVLVSCKKDNANEAVATTEYVVEKTNGAKWFEDNFGFLVAVPVGTILSLLLEFCFLFKSRKSTRQDLFENKLQREYQTEFIKESVEVQKELVNFVTNSNQKFDKIGNAVEKLTETNETLINKYDGLNDSQKVLAYKVDELINIFVYIASTNKDLVANGTAEKINALRNKDNM